MLHRSYGVLNELNMMQAEFEAEEWHKAGCARRDRPPVPRTESRITWSRAVEDWDPFDSVFRGYRAPDDSW